MGRLLLVKPLFEALPQNNHCTQSLDLLLSVFHCPYEESVIIFALHLASLKQYLRCRHCPRGAFPGDGKELARPSYTPKKQGAETQLLWIVTRATLPWLEGTNLNLNNPIRPTFYFYSLSPWSSWNFGRMTSGHWELQLFPQTEAALNQQTRQTH